MERKEHGGFDVATHEVGERLDAALSARIPGLSRAGARRWVVGGGVQVNGRPCRKGLLLREGDCVSWSRPPPPVDPSPEPQQGLALAVLYEDSDVVIVDKPPGLAAHPIHDGSEPTLASALVARYPEMLSVGYRAREPGLLHRLDNDTSGVLIAARNSESFSRLRLQLEAGEIDKRYLALCHGLVHAPTTISLPLVPKGRRQVGVAVGRVRASVHPTEVLSSEPLIGGPVEWSLVQVRACRARRHQIRAHLAACGHPLASDSLYGSKRVPGLGRHFLHASSVSFAHPRTGQPVEARAGLPEDLQQALSHLTRR